MTDANIVHFVAQKTTVDCEIHGEQQEGCLLPGDCLVCIKCMQELIDDKQAS